MFRGNLESPEQSVHQVTCTCWKSHVSTSLAYIEDKANNGLHVNDA